MDGQEKDFSSWHLLKSKLHRKHKAPTFQEREIWWCSIGLNVGFESDGKNRLFNRPVLVVRKFNQRLFWGIPLSTKMKDNPYYHRFTFDGKPQAAMLTHLRLYDSKRMTHKMGQLPKGQFRPIVHAISDVLHKQQNPRKGA
jgi:mRNA interferase MazF